MSGQGSTLFSVCVLLVPVLAIVQGLQLLRGLLASLSVYLGQVRDVDSATLAGVILLIFLSGFAAPLARRALGARGCLFVAAALLALLRVAEQLASTPEVRFGVEVAGVATWLWLIQMVAALLAPMHSKLRLPGAATVILLGLMIDTAINGAFATLDPGFSGAIGPLILTVALAGSQLAMLAWLTRGEAYRVPSRGPPIPAFAVGPVLALEVLLFQNLARQVVLIGWDLPAVLAWLLTANLIALWIATVIPSRGAKTPRWVWPIAAAVVVASAVEPNDPVWAAVVALAGPIAVGVLLSGTLAAGGGGKWGWVSAATGLLAIPLVLFGWYAHYEIDVPLPQQAIPPIAAALIAITTCIGFARSPKQVVQAQQQEAPVVGRRNRAWLIPASTSLLLLLPLYLFVTWRSPEPPPANAEPLRVATYNIHQGFDLRGMPGLERISAVLDSERPHVVALHEVPRGWAVNGSVDALSWLAQRLKMHAAWGPAADPFWGNAVLSRFPIVEIQNRQMPNNDDLNLDRAYLLVTIDLYGELVQVVATHLHHVEAESRHRIPQVGELLKAVDWSRPSVLLGDLNAQPHHTEIRMLTEAGLSAGDRVIPTYPANRPRRQIDYVMTTDAFELVESYTGDTDASDHLPLFADLLPNDR